ncbi:hypothetical protein CPB85DRAFT_1291024 [Mucidula mucida]|nr:hypothetical protein CPB85DRAFT_1291024 [Mucidula mucida]
MTFFEEYSIDQAPPIVRECIAKHHEDRLKQEETRYQRDESCDGATASAPPESSELRPMDVDEPESKPKRVPPPRLISPPSDGASSKHQRAQSMERQAPVKKASGKKSIASRKAGHKPPRKSSQRKTGQSPEVAIVSGNHYLGDPWRALLEKIFEDITPEPPLNWRNFLAYINSPESKVWNWFANRRQNYKGIRDTGTERSGATKSLGELSRRSIYRSCLRLSKRIKC